MNPLIIPQGVPVVLNPRLPARMWSIHYPDVTWTIVDSTIMPRIGTNTRILAIEVGPDMYATLRYESTYTVVTPNGAYQEVL